MSEKKQDEAPEVEAPQDDWDYPFSRAQVDAWKGEYGQDNIHLVKGFDDEVFVVRGFGREEFQDIAKSEFRNEDDVEDQYVLKGLLYPEISISDLRDREGGFSSQLFEKMMYISNVDAQRQDIPTALPKDMKELEEADPEALKLLKDSDVKNEDISQWFGAWKKLYYDVMEDKLFVYHGLRRKDYEKFRDGQRNGEHAGPASEEEMVETGTLYPFKIKALSNDYLHGTISRLSNLIYAASGFGTTTTVEKL
jgi:hypothetical protein